jgi:hypothetical protein
VRPIGVSRIARYDHAVTAPRVFALNAHASYACRHSGACCTAGWSIPVEPRVQALLGTDWLVPDAGGACPQFDRGTRLCRIHRDHGEALLPDSCHQFPRRAVIDARGTSVALSHYCPTAAALLLDTDAPLQIVEQPPAFPAGRGYEGLDARDEWPPLVRAGCLFDHASFAMWERYLVTTLGTGNLGIDHVLRAIAVTAERLRRWSPADGTLLEWTERTLGEPASDADHTVDRYAAFTGIDAHRAACRAVPSGLDTPAVPEQLAEIDATLVAPHWDRLEPFARRYVASKAFASWTAYQGGGVRTQVAELHLAAAVLRVESARACGPANRPLDRELLIEAISASDWLLVHLVDREPLVAWLGKVETDVPSHAPR